MNPRSKRDIVPKCPAGAFIRSWQAVYMLDGLARWPRIATKLAKSRGIISKCSMFSRLKWTRFEGRRLRFSFVPNKSVLFWPRMSSAAHTSFSWLTRLLLVSVLLGLFTASAVGGNRIQCSYNGSRPGASGGGKVRLNGFTVEVKPIPDPDFPAAMLPNTNDPKYMTCHASVRAPKGRTVFERNDWSMEIDPVTGKDLNGDGEPDAVLVGFSGGAYCCWTYSIISLGKKPGLIGEFESHTSASFKDLKGNGQIEILTRDGSFEGGFALDHASSPYPLLIVRMKGDRFEDVGFQFWQTYEM
jgi:hypothetical protein